MDHKIENYIEYIYSLNYKERPPTIKQFLADPKYLGTITNNGSVVYPIWQQVLEKVAQEDSKFLYVFTGCIGGGKTYTAIIGMLYTMCRILCLKNPWEYFKLGSGSQMSIVFFNLTKSQSESTGYKLFQTMLLSSSWFREHGIVKGSELQPKLEFNLFKYTFASPFVQGFGTQGENIILALMDEVDSPVASDIQRAKVIEAYENARRRLDSRFIVKGETIGRFFLVASKQERLSFLNTFIAKYKNSPNIVIIDIPIWEAKPASNYCGKKFKVSVGDIYNPPKICDTDEEAKEFQAKGFQIIDVPIEYLEPFQKDLVCSLRDIAGISVSHVRVSKLFPSETMLMKCYTKDPNPVKLMTVEVGLNDNIDLMNFLDITSIKVPKNVPRFIHQDYAYSGDGDASGLAMSCITGWTKKNIENADGTFRTERVPVTHTDFAMRIKAHPGDKIPIHKIRKFILDLKEVCKFNIHRCTFDLRIGTEDTKQILERAGIACDYLSMDKNPQDYRDFATLVCEGRWSTPWHPYLHFELKNLEDDPEKNMVDHPAEVVEVEMLETGNLREIVLMGSKDISDAVGGSITQAIKECITPPDIEMMNQLFGKMKPEVREAEKLWWVDAGIQIKREDPIPPKNQEAIQYNELLKKIRGLHHG